MKKREGLSRRRPEGIPHEWPLPDYNAFIALIEVSDARDEPDVIDRVTFAAKDIGIKPNHWLVQAILAFVFGRFPISNGYFYSDDAETFLRKAGSADREDREILEWALYLAGRGTGT